MKRISLFFLIVTSSLIFGACDVIEGPYLEEHDDGGVIGEKNLINVLILDFTGHTCKSCPKAHRTIDQLSDLYGDRVIPVAFHLGYFARPLSGDKFTKDFRTIQGAELESYYEFESFPIGLVGNLDKASLSSYSSWPTEVDAVMNDEATVELMTTIDYHENSREVQLTIKLINNSTLDGDVRLAVYLLEDGIISWQKDEDMDPIDIENYVHNHVFRTSVGSVWGETLSKSDCSVGANVQIEKFLVLEPSWVPENCSLVVFLYEAGIMEVIQCTREILIK